MHEKQKTRPRLPVGVVEKLQKNPGGGAHRNQKTDYRRQPKHRNRDAMANETFRHLYQVFELAMI